MAVCRYEMRSVVANIELLRKRAYENTGFPFSSFPKHICFLHQNLGIQIAMSMHFPRYKSSLTGECPFSFSSLILSKTGI